VAEMHLNFSDKRRRTVEVKVMMMTTKMLLMENLDFRLKLFQSNSSRSKKL
jgi:hypothetical protein